jgi:dipeptidyl aminopeptidase/acylaminoacyl peptidase
MRPEDVYELVNASDPRISPDGTRVAYVVTSIDKEESEYRSAIWLARVDGSEEPVQFTAGAKRDTSPRWSPDGRRLAFASSRGGEEKDKKAPANLYVIPAQGGEPRKLTDLKESVEAIAWSPDSRRLAFTARVRDEAYDEEDDRKRKPRRFTRVFHKLDSVGWTGDRRTHIFVVDADGSGEARQVTDGDFEHGNPAWTADGKQLVFNGLRDDNWDTTLINRLYVVDADGGEPRAITGDEGSYEMPAPAPDGARLAFRFEPEDGTYPHHSRIGVMNLDGSDRKILTESLDLQTAPYPDYREPVWDGERIVFNVEDGGNVHVYAVAADGSTAPERLLDGERIIPAFDCREGTLAYTVGTHTTMRELFIGDEQVTNVGKAFTEGRELAGVERFKAVSPDGYEVDGWVLRPAGFEEGKRYPALLSIHGGPFTQYGTGFFDEFQVYSGGGYAVLFSNPRGGSGYSEAHGRAIRGPLGDAGPGWGTRDYEDVMAVVDTALEKYDFIDPDRLGVLGGSYGGFMTSWIIGHTNRFKAAVSERAVNNLVSMFGSSDLFWIFERQFGGPYWENVDAYLERSPSTYAQQMETPVLVLHSEQDLRCNIEQGEHLFTLLRLLGKEVEMVRFPAESHELSRAGSPVHRVIRFETILDWFDRYLK